MAEELGVAERTVRRWANGEFAVPEGVWDELRSLAAERASDLSALAK